MTTPISLKENTDRIHTWTKTGLSHSFLYLYYGISIHNVAKNLYLGSGLSFLFFFNKITIQFQQKITYKPIFGPENQELELKTHRNNG